MKKFTFELFRLAAVGCVALAPFRLKAVAGGDNVTGQAVARLNARGFALLRKACELVPGGTAFVSPYGIDSALRFKMVWHY